MQHAAYLQAIEEINRLYEASIIGFGTGPHLQVYRRERARIWRRHGLTWRAFTERRGRVGRRRFGRI